MRWMIACCFGVGAVSFFPVIPSLLWLLPLAALGLIAIKYKLLKFVGALSFGVIWGILSGWVGLQHQLPESLENIDLNVVGQVVGLPATSERRQRFDLKIKTIGLAVGDNFLAAPKRIRINWYQTETLVLPGEIWQFTVRLRRPHGFANPGIFDYETWLFQQGIDATGYVREGEQNLQLKQAGLARLLDQIRFSLYQKLNQLPAGYQYKDVLIALLMGERSDLGGDLWQIFTRTGTNHLFVISGLHIGFVALCCYLLVMQIGRWIPLGAPVIALQQVASVAAILASVGYSALAGFALPTQRALIMLTLLMSGKILKRDINIVTSFVIALLCVLLLDPLAPRTVGFWLSFGAVGALLLGFAGYTSHQGFWWRWGRPQWLVFIAFIPLLLFFFKQFSVISPLANLVAIPLLGLLVVPLCLLAGLLLLVDESLAAGVLWVADRAIWGLITGLEFVAETPFAVVQLSPSVAAVVVASCGAIVLLGPRGLPGRWLALFCFIPLFIYQPPLKVGDYRVSFFDAGQGSSVLVETSEHRLLYDVGPAYDDKFNAATSVLLPYFQHRGIGRLDRILISHSDNDHAGSLPYLLDHIDYGDIVSGSVLKQYTKLPIDACQSGESWQWDGVSFQLMQASPEYWTSENNRSCVLKIDNGNFAVLLTGDIEREAEQSLLEQFGDGLKADFMLAPHHGSRTSSSLTFIQQAAPSWVIFTIGYKNRFGHPKPDIVERYRLAQIKTLDTISSGLIKVTVAAEHSPVLIESFRQSQMGYWYPK